MFSFLFGSSEEVKEEVKVEPDPDWEIEPWDHCEPSPGENTIDRIKRLADVIPKNLKNEYFREGS